MHLHPLQAFSYIVTAITAVGALYLGYLTFRALQRDRKKALEERQERDRLDERAKSIRDALEAAEQAALLESLQDQIIEVNEELDLVRRRQRRGMTVQFASAIVFLALLVGLFFYDHKVTTDIQAVRSQAQNATVSADSAITASGRAMELSKQGTSHKPAAPSKRSKEGHANPRSE